MDVLVAGGHGKVALRLLRRLAGAGHQGRGMVRNPEHVADLEAVGAQAVVCDLEHEDPRPHIGRADAIVFAAGAGPGSGPERKRTVDFGAAAKLIEAAIELGVRRYVIVSSMGTREIEQAPEGMRPYLRAKAAADDALRTSGLDWTIVKPGALTDGPGSDRVDVAPVLGRQGEIPREDVAAVLVACLEAPNSIGAEFEVLSGDTPVADAIRGL